MAVDHITRITCERCGLHLQLWRSDAPSKKAARHIARVQYGWNTSGESKRVEYDICKMCMAKVGQPIEESLTLW